MIPIKLQCECGQRFAFEVKPVHGRMPAPVNCPACDADNTAAANAFLAQSAEPQPEATPASTGPLRVSLPPRPESAAKLAVHAEVAAPRRPAGPQPGQIGRTQAKFEARAKIGWGDPPIQVLAYLRSQGYGKDEAAALLEELVAERAATVRGKGIMNIVGGFILMCLPVLGYFIFMAGEYIYVRFFSLMVFAGLYGIWLIIKGVGMIMAPKSAFGDVEDQ